MKSILDSLLAANVLTPQVSSGAALEFLIRDEFITARAAGAVNGTPAEPGPGTRVVTDTGSFAPIVGGEFTTTDVAGNGDPGLWYAAQIRATGLTALMAVNCNKRIYVGWDDAQANIATFSAALVQDTNLYFMNRGANSGPIVTIVNATDYEVAVPLRTAGSFVLIRGGAWVDWTLMWISNTDVTAAPFPAYTTMALGADIHSLDYFRVAQLAAPWDTDYGIATQRLAGARAPGDTFVHEADCHIEFECTTLPGGGQIELWFRIQDALNYWAVTVNAAGDLELDEVVAGVTTQQGVALATIVNGDRIVIIAAGTTIRVFEGTPDGQTRRIIVVGAVNFQTETDGELDTEGAGGAVSDIISWPRYMSSAALAELNKYSA